MKNQPTKVELQILDVLWNLKRGSVREVHDLLQSSKKKTVYASTVKMMSIMFEKGLLKRDQSVRPHLYWPAVTRPRAQKGLLRELLHGAFEGSTKGLILRALSTERPTDEELAEVSKVIEELRRANKEGGSDE